jgi:hypothetical protein
MRGTVSLSKNILSSVSKIEIETTPNIARGTNDFMGRFIQLVLIINNLYAWVRATPAKKLMATFKSNKPL